VPLNFSPLTSRCWAGFCLGVGRVITRITRMFALFAPTVGTSSRRVEFECACYPLILIRAHPVPAQVLLDMPCRDIMNWCYRWGCESGNLKFVTEERSLVYIVVRLPYTKKFVCRVRTPFSDRHIHSARAFFILGTILMNLHFVFYNRNFLPEMGAPFTNRSAWCRVSLRTII
jgi:hypothetical protein